MGKKRSNRGFVAIKYQFTITPGALGVDDVLKNSTHGAAFGEDLYAISTDCIWSIEDHTVGRPIGVGFAHYDLTNAEIAEGITAELTDPDDIIARERNRRPIRSVGKFDADETDEVLNDGKAIRTKLGMSIGDGHFLAAWANNRGQSALVSGALIKGDGVLYARWQR